MRSAAKRSALPLEEVVFVDDQPRNVEGARRAGLDAVQFDVTNPESSFAEAEARLGLDERET